MITRRILWQLVLPAALLVLLGILATLQYRWLGAVSEAERERMRTGLRTRTSELVREFNAEITRTYVAFHVDSDGLDRDASATLSDAYQRWQASAPAPDLVRAVFLLGPRGGAAANVLRRLDVDGRRLEAAEWPADIEASLARTQSSLPRLPGAPAPSGTEGPPMLMFDAIDSRIPALFVAVPFLKKVSTGQRFTLLAASPAAPRFVVVVLDRERLESLIGSLVAKHFGGGPGSDYLVTIVRRDESSPPVFTFGDVPVAGDAEVTMGLFDLRLDTVNQTASEQGGVRLQTTERVAVTVMRRTTPADGHRLFIGGSSDDQGAWLVRVRYRSGSLDAIVRQSRRRNVAISLGVLGLLGGSIALIVAAAQRQQRLARQQMEFVAAVSHELRTPLAVICSAGENLADGVVADPPQVNRYGSLIHSEGHRLRDMVERVLEFSGISSAKPFALRGEVDLSQVIVSAVDAVSREARGRDVNIAVDRSTALPAVAGEASALRSAVVNIIGNAVKYSPAGGVVDVSASAHGSRVRLRVADRGLGIDHDDLPHIFKPFYRGRRAIDAQVRGTGIGLSIVRNVIEAHRGEITVESRPGEGTAVVLELPAVSEGHRRGEEAGELPGLQQSNRQS